MKKVSEDIPGYTRLAAPHRDGPSASPLRRHVELRQRSGLSGWSDPHRKFGPGTRALDVLEHGVPGTAMPSWSDKLSDSDRQLHSGHIRSFFATPTLREKEQPHD
jgi:hypothetical protein